MKKDYDIFKAEVLWESGNTSITDVAVPVEECFKCALIKMENKDIPMWIIRQTVVEKCFQRYRKLVGMQGGVILGLVDENLKRIVSD